MGLRSISGCRETRTFPCLLHLRDCSGTLWSPDVVSQSWWVTVGVLPAELADRWLLTHQPAHELGSTRGLELELSEEPENC